MSALAVLLVGVVIVVGGILVLRMHAFVALTLAALFVALLTPRASVVRQSILDRARQAKLVVASVGEDGRTVRLTAPSAKSLAGPQRLAVIRPGADPWRYEQVGEIVILTEPAWSGETEPERVVTVELADGVEAVATTDVVISAEELERALAAGKVSPPERVAAGFGNTAAGIGILIAFASIIGKCLLESGAADRIVRSALQVTGEAGAPMAFVISGFVLGIPVFFDTVFYLMLPLGKALRFRTGRNFLLYVLTIIAGATMAHSLVPPTPGPLVAAEMLGVDVGLMILVGLVVGLGTALSGYLWAVWINRRVDLPVRDVDGANAAAIEQRMAVPDHELPALWLSLVPIVLPVILIGGREVVKTALQPTPAVMSWVDLVGNKNVALILAAFVAVVTLLRQRHLSRQQLAAALQNALSGAGVIILITSAGGAFGAAIGQTGVATLIGQLSVQSPAAQLTVAFLISVAIRSAQGSATVAMITSASIFAPLAVGGELTYHPVWLAIAIGCGSKAIAWMNDSGFWVITQMSGMSEAEGLKYVTPMMIVMAVVGLVLVLIGATLFPLV